MSGSSLTCDTISYIYVTYGPRERCPEGRAAQPSSPPARAIQPAPSSRETGSGVFDLPSSGLPLPAASPASQRTGSYWRRQVGVHRQTLAGRDRKSATIRGHRGAVDRRGRHASPAGMAASGARAWRRPTAASSNGIGGDNAVSLLKLLEACGPSILILCRGAE